MALQYAGQASTNIGLWDSCLSTSAFQLGGCRPPAGCADDKEDKAQILKTVLFEEALTFMHIKNPTFIKFFQGKQKSVHARSTPTRVVWQESERVRHENTHKKADLLVCLQGFLQQVTEEEKKKGNAAMVKG
eukprot:1145836-Pelagomonas_calceolata.AAC.8